MQTPLQTMRIRERLTKLSSTASRAGSGPIWSLDQDRLRALEAGDGGRPIVLVPTEQVLLLAVDLPLPTRRKRLDALPFALEDAIADPPETVHMALGEEVAPRRYLAGVVAHTTMREWTARLAVDGIEDAALVPDALTLPQPPEGHWAVDLVGERTLVRAADGTGFALHASQFPAVWAASGRPSCIAYGIALAPEMTADAVKVTPLPLSARLLAPALDLRQGAYARQRRQLGATWRRLAIVLGAGVVAHGAIAAADTVALRDMADKREAETRALVAQVAPGRANEDLIATAADLLPSGSAAMPGRFVPLLSRTSNALAPVASAMTLKGMVFDETSGSLELTVETADVAALQRVETALTNAGLAATSGGATAADGKAEGRITVRMEGGAA